VGVHEVVHDDVLPHVGRARRGPAGTQQVRHQELGPLQRGLTVIKMNEGLFRGGGGEGAYGAQQVYHRDAAAGAREVVKQ
jgi:hypothetical protein